MSHANVDEWVEVLRFSFALLEIAGRGWGKVEGGGREERERERD